jgi:uncharacterized radical SAM superfamily Fe-S cluster-containing enzyme
MTDINDITAFVKTAKQRKEEMTKSVSTVFSDEDSKLLKLNNLYQEGGDVISLILNEIVESNMVITRDYTSLSGFLARSLFSKTDFMMLIKSYQENKITVDKKFIIDKLQDGFLLRYLTFHD